MRVQQTFVDTSHSTLYVPFREALAPEWHPSTGGFDTVALGSLHPEKQFQSHCLTFLYSTDVNYDSIYGENWLKMTEVKHTEHVMHTVI